MTISNERFATFFLNWWERSEKDFTLSDMEDICKDIGMTRSEFIELVSRSDEFISRDGWTPEVEIEANEKVNTETGDTDRAILEAALMQIGIPYTWEESKDGSNCGWVDLKIVDDGEVTENTAAEIYFTKDGKFDALY